MKKKESKRMTKRFTVVLGERDLRRLTAYAVASRKTRPVALQQLLKKALHDVPLDGAAGQVDEKQLTIFDTLQIDIFNNTTRINREA